MIRRTKKTKCPECGHTYRDPETHSEAKCQLLQVYRRKNKMGAERVEVPGFSYASKLEHAVHQILLLRERAEEIKILKVQDRLELCNAGYAYLPDFKCLDLRNNEEFWVEAKGHEGPRWGDIKKHWRANGPGRLEIWKGDYRNPQLVETIKPRRAK